MNETVHARWAWLEHLIPLQFLRVLWDALFPSRFRQIVLDGLDGTPRAEHAKPLTFCLGCWLLLFATVQAFPWAFKTTGIAAILEVLPAADRHAVAHAIGIDTIKGVRILDSGHVVLGKAKHAALAVAHHTLGKRVGRVAPDDVAQYLESHGNGDLALRLRGYVSRANDRPAPFDQTTLIFFVVFGLYPGWLVSHAILKSRLRASRETRHVHMYNDGWFVVTVLVPFSLATYSGEAAETVWTQRSLAAITLFAILSWVFRTIRLYRVTHDAPAWRVAAAHVGALLVALVMCATFIIAGAMIRATVSAIGL